MAAFITILSWLAALTAAGLAYFDQTMAAILAILLTFVLALCSLSCEP